MKISGGEVIQSQPVCHTLVGWLFPEFTDAYSLSSRRYMAQRSSNAGQIVTSEL